MAKLTRSIEGKKLFGVCAGIAKHYNMNVNVVRIITALVVIFTGIGALAYFAAGFMLPEE